MSWGRPFILLALILIPLTAWLLFWAKRQRQRALAQLGDVALLIVGQERARLRQAGLWLLALTSLIIALARPQWGAHLQPVPNPPLQIVFALDVSQSMLATDMLPDRFTQARNMIGQLLPLLPNSEAGLVLFAGKSSLRLPLTADHQLFLTQLDRIDPSQVMPQGTALAEAIETAVTAFDPLQYSQKIIVILSDGENHENATDRAVQTAVAQHITIHTIGFGSVDGAPIPTLGFPSHSRINNQGSIIWSHLNQRLLQEIATEGHGQYFTTESEVEIIREALFLVPDKAVAVSVPVEKFQIFLLIAWAALIGSKR